MITWLRNKKMIKQKSRTGIERCGKSRQQVKTKKIDRIVKGVCIYWILFVCVAWVTFWVKDAVPDTLVQFGLGGGAVELLVTGIIEIMRDRTQRRAEDE